MQHVEVVLLREAAAVVSDRAQRCSARRVISVCGVVRRRVGCCGDDIGEECRWREANEGCDRVDYGGWAWWIWWREVE